ncbi:MULTISPECIES: ATPase, T2SS/T4P/T4SS family [Cysteiniphilum]|uniref:ATPase, T2SS/T4P/T4SS family n=1 Tax=Cysteiniphilum TaxID=2056696 RepID=UPI001781B561|nr:MULTISPECIES: ATPase, T2SS/T4P/T4SS family [Cysteiniphilum]
MIISQLSQVDHKPNRLLYEEAIASSLKDKVVFYESVNKRFVSLILENIANDQKIEALALDLRLKASKEYELDKSKTYFVKQNVITEVRNKVSDGKVHDHEKLRVDFERLLKEVIDKQASDIHIFVKPTRAYIMLREFGELRHFRDYNVGYMHALVSAMYNDLGEEGSKDSEFSPYKIQETVIERFINHKKYRIRFASVNIVSSDSGANRSSISPYKVTLRILPTDESNIKSFQMLGYRANHIKRFEKMTMASSGVVITSGSVNSGKSTTLSCIVEKIIAKYPYKHIISIESPVEYFISADTVAQHPVHTSADMDEGVIEKSYKSAQNIALRTDIDVAYLNEIRNIETAKFAQLIVQSGHLFLSTLHAQSALNIINRLTALGVERDVLCSPNFIQLLIHQSLLQKVCQHCAYDYQSYQSVANDSQLMNRLNNMFERYGLSSIYKNSLRFRNNNGCQYCSKGIKGLTVAAEIVKPSGQLLELIATKQQVEAYKYWRSTGELTLKEDGILKLLKGEVCPSSLELKLGAIDELEMSDCFDADFFKSLLGSHLEESQAKDLVLN